MEWNKKMYMLAWISLWISAHYIRNLLLIKFIDNQNPRLTCYVNVNPKYQFLREMGSLLCCEWLIHSSTLELTQVFLQGQPQTDSDGHG